MSAVRSISELQRPPALPGMTAQVVQVVDAFRRQAAISSTDIYRLANWSRQRVTSVVGRRFDHGFLMEVGEGQSQRGCRPTILRLNSQLGYLIGVDIGATSMDLAVADLYTQVLMRDTGPADVHHDPAFLLGELGRERGSA